MQSVSTPRQLFHILFLLLLTLSPCVALAQNDSPLEHQGWYAGVEAAPALIGSSGLGSDLGISVGGFIGYDMGDWRIEPEAAYTYIKIEEDLFGVGLDWTITQWKLMVNGWYDFLVTSAGHTAYAGIGVGIAGVKSETTVSVGSEVWSQSQYDLSGTTFGYQFGGGFIYRLTERIDLDFIAHYAGLHLNASTLGVRLRYKF